MINLFEAISGFALLGMISALFISLYSIQSAINAAKREEEECKRKQAEQEMKIEKMDDGLYIRVTEETPIHVLKRLHQALEYGVNSQELNKFYNARIEKWRDELVNKLISLELSRLKELPPSQLERLTEEIKKM